MYISKMHKHGNNLLSSVDRSPTLYIGLLLLSLLLIFTFHIEPNTALGESELEILEVASVMENRIISATERALGCTFRFIAKVTDPVLCVIPH